MSNLCKHSKAKPKYQGFEVQVSVIIILTVFCLITCRKSDNLQLAGIVEKKTLELSAPISELIVQIPVEKGQRVDSGQAVVLLDTEVVAAELLAQESALAAAEALYSETNDEFKRQEELYKSRVASIRSLDVARRQRDEALALVNERKARVLQAKRRLNDLTITSRSSGYIDQIPFEVGERVPAGGVVAVIISDEKAWVRIWVPAHAASRLSLQAKADVKVEGLEKRIDGTLEYISSEPEFTPHFALTERESSHLVYEAHVVLENAPGNLRPGLPAQVYLRLSSE